jgi:hypothetical protein
MAVRGFEDLRPGVVHRIVYVHVRGRFGRFYPSTDVEAIRRKPPRGLGPFDPPALADPEVTEAIDAAVDDAIECVDRAWRNTSA